MLDMKVVTAQHRSNSLCGYSISNFASCQDKLNGDSKGQWDNSQHQSNPGRENQGSQPPSSHVALPPPAP